MLPEGELVSLREFCHDRISLVFVGFPGLPGVVLGVVRFTRYTATLGNAEKNRLRGLSSMVRAGDS